MQRLMTLFAMLMLVVMTGCQQAARIGIETWCDPTIQAGHIGECEY